MQKSVEERSKKQMLWVAMISMTMMFAGLTSAYVVSQKREDWVHFDLPNAFIISTLFIILSSLSFILAKKAVLNGKNSLASGYLTTTLFFGIAFVYSQFNGFSELIDAGLYFTGKESNIASSFLYVITLTHLLHIFAGIIVLIVILVNQLRGKYTPDDHLGLDLGAVFWHFVDALWIYLFLFFYFIG